MVRLLEYWQRLEAEKKEGEEANNEEENEEFSLDIGNHSEEVENNTGIQINIEDATPQKEVGEPSFENCESGMKSKIRNGTTSEKDDEEPVVASKQKDLNSKEDKEEGNSLPFIDDGNEDESTSDITLEQTKDKEPGKIVSKEGDDADSGYKSGMKKFFQNVSEAQQGDEGDFSVESRYSDEDSEIKTILGSGQKKRDSKYIAKSSDDEETSKKSKCGKIPVLDTSESEFEESELSRAGFSNFAFDDKE